MYSYIHYVWKSWIEIVYTAIILAGNVAEIKFGGFVQSIRFRNFRLAVWCGISPCTCMHKNFGSFLVDCQAAKVNS